MYSQDLKNALKVIFGSLFFFDDFLSHLLLKGHDFQGC